MIEGIRKRDNIIEYAAFMNNIANLMGEKTYAESDDQKLTDQIN